MNRFDRILWRVNGALFLISLVGVILFFAPNFSQIFLRPPPRPSTPPTIVREEQGTHDKESLLFGAPSRVSATQFIRLPLQSESEIDASLSTKDAVTRIYNYLYVDVTSLSSWWLFKGSDQLISRVHDLRVETGERDRATVATLFGVILADTDRDHRLTLNDREAIYFCGPDGRNPFEILSATDGILSIEPIVPNQVLIIYQRGSDTMGTVFSTQNGGRVREAILAVSGR